MVVVSLVAAMLGVSGGVAQAGPPPVTFGPRTDFYTGTAPTSVAVADLNGDTYPDMAVVNYSPDTVSVLLGDGSGGFAAATAFPTGTDPYAVAVADLNGDTYPDLAVTNYLSNDVSVLLGDGSGGFGAKTDFATGDGPYAVAVGDLNGDTYPDLAVANLGRALCRCCWATGQAGSERTPTSKRANPLHRWRWSI